MSETISETLTQVPLPEFTGEALQTRTVLDEQGYERRLYDVGPDVSVIFRGREELPTLSSDVVGDTRSATVLTVDEKPHQVDQTEFSEYLVAHPTTESEQSVLIANATPVGIIDLSLRLSGEDDSLRTMRGNFLSGAIGERENAVLDMMSAALFVDSPSTSVERTDGLFDVVAALSGDERKRAELLEKQQILEQRQHEARAQDVGEEAVGLVEANQPIPERILEQTNDLVMVRATNNEPHYREDGVLTVAPAAAYTRDILGADGKAYVPRYTTHFALNHYVESHINGDISSRQSVIISPLRSVLETGTKPTNLLGVDTYFTTGPGEELALPDAKIVQRGGNQADIINIDGDKRTYKSEGYVAADIERVIAEAIDGDVRNALFGPESDIDADLKRLRVENNLPALLIRAGYRTGLVTSNGDSQRVDSDGRLVDIKALAATELGSMDYQQILAAVEAVGPDALDAIMSSMVEDLLIKSTIREMGGEVITPSGTSNYIASPSNFDGRMDSIAAELHVTSQLHTDSFEARFEELAFKMLLRSKLHETGRYQWEDANEGAGDALSTLMARSDCPQKLRRAALEAGLLSVRDDAKKHTVERASLWNDESPFL